MYIDNHRGESIEIGDRATIANSGTLDTSLFGKSVDAFTASSLVVESTEERTIAIEGDTLDATQFPGDVLHTAFAFDTLFVLTRLASLRRKKQGALEALSMIARGMIEEDGRMHGQADGTARSAMSQASKRCLGRFSERNSSDAVVTSGGFMDVPRIIGCIADQVGREVIEGENGLTRERAERRDIVFVEGLSLFGEHDGSLLSHDGGSDAGPRAPDELFLFLGGAIGLFLVGTAFDP